MVKKGKSNLRIRFLTKSTVKELYFYLKIEISNFFDFRKQSVIKCN